jgi:hypothetical protein
MRLLPAAQFRITVLERNSDRKKKIDIDIR